MSLFGFLLRRSWRLVAVAMAAGVVSGLAAAAVLALVHAAISRSPVSSGLVGGFVGLGLLGVISKVLAEVLLTRLGQATVAELRVQLSRRILASPLRRIEELGPHRLLATLNDDATVIAQAYAQLPLLCVNAATVIGCLLYLGWLSGWALAVVMGAVAVGSGLFHLHERPALRFFKRARETSDVLFQNFRSLTGGIKELKLHRSRGEAFLSSLLGRSVAAYRRDFVAGMSLYSVAMGWATLLFYGALGVTVFLLPSWTGLSASVVAGSTLAILYLLAPVAHLVEMLPAVGRAGVALRKVQDLGLALTPEREGLVLDHPPPAWKRLDLVGVTHRYYREQEEESFRLGPIDLTFRPGEIVFLVGGNGCGKTTLALLLLGLYTPDAGEIRLDGVAVTDASRERYRQLFSVVFADYHLFQELLGVGDPQVGERARRYLARLQLERRVRIDGDSLRADGLSQGQRKRLALLAAALDDRPFYVFDEWASDQDPEFRKVFYTELLPELRARGKTALVISHDDQYFGIADRCLRMDFGLLTPPAAAPLVVAESRNSLMRSAP